MPAILEIPQVVEDSLDQFADLFANGPQRRHLAEYLTGLMVASNKTVSGIQAEFVDTTDQSCLNRFLTEVDWDVEALNARRLELLQTDPSTCYHKRGVIAVDDVLIDHDGKLIKEVGWFWDHAEQRHKIAHDYLFASNVCPNGKHYPLEFRRFKKREQFEATGETFEATGETCEDHGVLFRQLVDWVCEREIPGDFTFDSYFSSAANLNHIHEQQNVQGESRAYVGDLKTNRNRWTGTETFHRDGKQELSMGDCQLRSGQGQTRHMYLVMLAYSLLMKQLKQPSAKEWAIERLTTIGQACRAVATETLRTTLAWAIDQVTNNSRKPQHVMAQLGLI